MCSSFSTAPSGVMMVVVWLMVRAVLRGVSEVIAVCVEKRYGAIRAGDALRGSRE
jgi:hypothetical protein